jgi:hypothetical protein
MKLLSALPASFLSAVSNVHVANAGADEIMQTARAKRSSSWWPSIDSVHAVAASAANPVSSAVAVGIAVRKGSCQFDMPERNCVVLRFFCQ